MRLHLHEWGDPSAPPLVCLHGISAHGRRFRRLGEGRWARRFRVLAPDLRGHGRSGFEPPWDLATHLADTVETVRAAGVARATWLGHSFGARLVLELAAREPDLLERAVLLDPAIEILPHVGYDFAERARVAPAFASVEEAFGALHEPPTPPELLEEDLREHLELSPDGKLRFRICPSAVVTGYSEICTAPPPPETLRVPTLLLYAHEFGLVREEQVEAYARTLGDVLAVVTVPGGHVVYWDAYEATADAIDRFLA
jgi:lipase